LYVVHNSTQKIFKIKIYVVQLKEIVIFLKNICNYVDIISIYVN